MAIDRVAVHGSGAEAVRTRGSAFRPVIAVTTLAGLGLLALQVGQQSNVQGAWQQAAADCSAAAEALSGATAAVSRAGHSVAKAGQETVAVWRQCAPSRAA